MFWGWTHTHTDFLAISETRHVPAEGYKSAISIPITAKCKIQTFSLIHCFRMVDTPLLLVICSASNTLYP